MASIEVRSTTVEFSFLSVEDYNLKRSLVTGLTRRKRRGETVQLKALDDISLNIPEGTRLAVIGANGAGKSTLLRVLSGALPPTRGRIMIDGQVLPMLGGSAAGLEPELTGVENIMLMGLALGEPVSVMRGRLAEIAEFSGLGDRLRNPVRTYSSGMSARLRFSVLTTQRPEILIMDEGVATADAEFSTRAGNRLNDFIGSAGILVMSAHGPGFRRICNRAVWMHEGRVVLDGGVNSVYEAYAAFTRRRGGSDAESVSAVLFEEINE